MEKIGLVFILLVVYQIKHFIADFPLQTWWMLGKFKEKGWVLPLAAHAGVHALLTLLIVLRTAPEVWWISGVDFGIHFTMDRIKASPALLGRYKSLCQHDLLNKPNMDRARWEGKLRNNQNFWWSLGIDQMVHHLTHYYLIWEIIQHA
jgi:Protein of unknown function (DUF3307)